MSRREKMKAAFVLFFSVFLVCAWKVGPLHGAEVSGDPDIRRDGTLDFLTRDGSVFKSIAIEIAEKPEDQIRGLMGRTRLDESVGMLFIYDRADIRIFWMRNTPRSLDMIFVSDRGEVINIEKGTEPMSDRTYLSKGPAACVLEVVAGFTDRYGIERGTRIRWQRR